MSNFAVIRFALIICLACSLLVSGAAIGLRERQEANKALDIQKNILKSVGLLEEGMSAEQVAAVYDESINGLVLSADGTVQEGRNPAEVDLEKEPDTMILYQRIDDGEVSAYTFPIVGRGLWSTLYGYLAVDSDMNTVRGITFYDHGETPGLGGEISMPWFQENFVGKKLHDDSGAFKSVVVVKGAAADKYREPELSHYVDGISGATITANGVTDMVAEGYQQYDAYFSKIRGPQGRTS